MSINQAFVHIFWLKFIGGKNKKSLVERCGFTNILFWTVQLLLVLLSAYTPYCMRQLIFLVAKGV